MGLGPPRFQSGLDSQFPTLRAANCVHGSGSERNFVARESGESTLIDKLIKERLYELVTGPQNRIRHSNYRANSVWDY